MSEKSVILSISMLISGQDDMPKSLKSLIPFKEALPTEIILVDTGCDHKQRALAEQYADRIIDFVWCDDFAAARNTGLMEAQGEWFLFLDDDEWFEDPKEIIDFFLTGEYRQYNSATYPVRNYANFEGTMYEDAYLPRMVKLTPETRFEGRIHEYLTPFELPRKKFSAFVHHYGYVYRNEEEKRKHALRNIEPLREMRKQHPGDPRWICQLTQEYFAIHEYREAVQECERGLAEWKLIKEKARYVPSHVGGIYAYLLISLESLEAYGEEEKWLERAMGESVLNTPQLEPTLAFFCMAGAKLYRNMGNYGKSLEHFRRYIAYYQKYKDDRESVENGTAAITGGVFQEWILYGTILMCTESAIREEDYSFTEEVFYLIDWQDRRLLQQTQWEMAMLDACCCVAYHPLWVRILQTLVSREDGMEETLAVFLETEREYRQRGEEEKLLNLICLAAKLQCDHPYVQRAKEVWEELLKNAGLSEKAAEKQDSAERQEMAELAEKLKAAARQQIEAGNFQTAREILLQIQQCFPEDEETEKMLKSISGILD